MAAIRTSVEVARDQGDGANWSGAADTVLAEESRLEALLDDLLLLAAHDEAPTTEGEREAVGLEPLVAAEADRPRRVPVHVTPPVGASAPRVVPGSAGQLERVVANLLDNAARHAQSVVQVGLARTTEAVRLTIDDDGPGIPPAHRERIFERFTRLDDSRSRSRGGSGLGLAVVRSIVARHGGHVWAEDSPLGGARFVVDLRARSTPLT